jgi:dephospho-CoA kinase
VTTVWRMDDVWNSSGFRALWCRQEHRRADSRRGHRWGRGYFGAAVLRAVSERGLPETSASEQIVRIALRAEYGRAHLAALETERIRAVLAERRYVLVDAIYCRDELEYLSKLTEEFSLIGIEASFGTRLARLGMRATRPMTEPQLRERDAVDLVRLETDNVLAQADLRISNEGSMAEFQSLLCRRLTERSV